MHQLSLFPEKPTLAEKFRAFDEAHPDVFELLVKLGRQVRAAGKKRFGAKALMEQVRWSYAVSSNEAPVLNNSYTAFYARKLAETFPEEFGNGFFEFREQRNSG